jgi:hypothetical protein
LKGFFFGGRLSAMSATLRRTGADSASLQLSPLVWLGAGAALYLLISIQMRYHERVEEWQRLMGSLQMLLRTCKVYASMQGEYSLLGGESLHMAQLRRAGELLAAADGAHRGIFIIDQIFRGTSHLESVSAAAAVLDALAAKGLVIVSSCWRTPTASICWPHAASARRWKAMRCGCSTG